MNWQHFDELAERPLCAVDTPQWHAYDQEMARQLKALEARCGPVRTSRRPLPPHLKELLQARRRPKPR